MYRGGKSKTRCKLSTCPGWKNSLHKASTTALQRHNKENPGLSRDIAIQKKTKLNLKTNIFKPNKRTTLFIWSYALA